MVMRRAILVMNSRNCVCAPCRGSSTKFLMRWAFGDPFMIHEWWISLGYWMKIVIFWSHWHRRACVIDWVSCTGRYVIFGSGGKAAAIRWQSMIDCKVVVESKLTDWFVLVFGRFFKKLHLLLKIGIFVSSICSSSWFKCSLPAPSAEKDLR